MTSIDAEQGDGAEGGDGEGAGRPPTKRAQQKAETRRRLLDAATEVFLESGPMTASLDEVAARAGVSRPTLFFHFGSRAELMVELIGHHVEHFRSRARDFHPGEFRPYLEAYLLAQRTRRVRLVWMLSDLVYADNPEGPNAAFLDLLAELEERLSSAGLAADEAHQRALVVAYGVNTVARRVAYGDAPDEEIQEFLEAACRVAAAPPAAPSAVSALGSRDGA